VNSISEITALRLRLQEAGFDPIAVRGKIPVLEAWQAKTFNADDIRKWESDFDYALNTGITCRKTPTFDIDILNPDAAAAVEDLARERFEERGKLLTRTGLAPKRAIPFRTDIPFRKKLVLLTPPNGGEEQRIEFLGEGQQFLGFGTHPDTRKPYHWFGGELGPTRREDLPDISETEAQQLVDDAVALLIRDYGYTLASPDTCANGSSSARSNGERVDIEAEFASMTPDNVNEKQIRIIPAMIWRGIHPDEILGQVTTRTMEMAARFGKAGWTEKREAEKFVVKRISSALKNLFLKKYDPATGSLPSWLCPDFHRAWIDALAAGKEPRFGRNQAGFYIRAYDPKTGEEGAAEESAPGEATAAKEEPRQERKKKAAPNTIILRPFIPLDPATYPCREVLFGRHYQRRTVSATTGPGGSGKSSANQVEAASMASCRNLLEEQPAERLRVWYHNGEDNYEELGRRVLAICQHYNIPQEELVGWFFMTSGNEFPLRVATGYNTLAINAALIDQIRKQIEENKVDVAIFDPLITLHGVPENDNVKMAQVLHIFGEIADEYNCAIEISHHTRKPSNTNGHGGYDAMDTRGAGSIHDTVRALRVFNRMSESEAMAVDIPDYQRVSYFRIDRGKGNYSPPAKAVWRHFINVELPNGDEVGVVTPWNYPGQGLTSTEVADLERIAEHVFMQLLNRFILQGRAVGDRPRGNYAPRVFAGETEAKIAKLTLQMLEGAMKRLFASGRIRVESSREGRYAARQIVPTS
jgi:hypothetical protein